MSYDTLGMIRRGWQDGAATVAPQVPGLGDLLEQQLGEAIRLGHLDEASLLSIVDAATQLAANSGAVGLAPALSKRLRRHVYEYLLSLDATPEDRPASSGQQPSSRDDGVLLIGADEVVSVQPVEGAEPGAGYPGGAGEHRGWPSPTPRATEPHPGGDGSPRSPLPQFGFHIGDPDDLLSTQPQPVRGAGHAHGWSTQTGDPSDDRPARRASFADPSTWPKPVPPSLRGGREPSNGGTPTAEQPAPGPEPAAPEPIGTRFEELEWPAGAPTDSRVEPVPEVAQPSPAVEALPDWHARWPAPGAPGAEANSELPGLAQDTGSPPVTSPEWRPDRLDDDWLAAPAESPRAAGAAPDTPADLEPRGGWAVRQPEAVELHLAPPGGETETRMPPATDIPESDLAALRVAVEQRLRKKRCEEAAALLQQAAQELGGQAVAELALDAGDRCRTLGKRNAALNCYLAASRSDPVYEPPLARLADICIDDQDIDLAVSYLERIARLTRLRGDGRGALRIYRKIATIAPYRDDVLDMLMRAQGNARMEP